MSTIVQILMAPPLWLGHHQVIMALTIVAELAVLAVLVRSRLTRRR